MFLKVLSFLRWAAVEAKGAVCPKCHGTNTKKENGIWACNYCGHEW
jgi:ribosomal protein L37AE/L43A